MKKIIITATTLVFALCVFAKPLKLEVPPSQIEGTPVPIKIENLEPKTPNPEPDVPADVVNVSKGKKVTSSDDFPLIGELELITDGDKAAAQGSFVEIQGGLQWVQIDLEKTVEIFAIAMWHYHLQERAYKDVIVQVSDDPDFQKDVKTVFNNDHDNSAKKGKGENKAYIETNLGKLVVVNPAVKGRYVRFYSAGNTSNDTNSYTEIEIYGR